MKKTIFFDIGNVLLFFSHEKMCTELARLTGRNVDEVIDLFFRKKIFSTLFEEGKISEEELLSYLQTKQKIDMQALMHAVTDIFVPNEAIFPLIQKLKKQDKQLVIISNTCPPHYKYAYANYPIFKLFDDAVLSYEENIRKPDHRIFHKALERAKAKPEDCFFIDDLTENVAAAKECGIYSHLYKELTPLTKELEEKGFMEG